MTRFFKKSKNTLFRDHFGPFSPKFVQEYKKGLCQFLNITIIYHCAIIIIPEKNAKLKDKWINNSDFTETSLGQGQIQCVMQKMHIKTRTIIQLMQIL